MNLRLKDFTTGLDLINEAIRLYRPVEQSDEWREALPEKTVVGRLANLFSTHDYLRFKEYLMVNNGNIGLKVDTLAGLRESYITFHVLIHGSQNGTRGQRTQQEVSYFTGGPRDKKNVECYGCGRKGHSKRDCRRKNEWESYALKKKGERASAANTTKDSPDPPQPPDDTKKNKRRQKRLLNKLKAEKEELHFAFAARQQPWEKSVEFF